MQDFKHFNRRRPIWPFNKEKRQVNRRLSQPIATETLLEESPRKKRQLRFILPLLASLLAAYPVAELVKKAVLELSQRTQTPAVAAPVPAGPISTWQSFQWAAQALGTATLSGDQMIAALPNGSTITYGFDRELQDRVHDYLAAYRVPYGVFIALEPKTGRVLAMTSYSADNPQWSGDAFYQLYPMASLFKIITAAAALEQKKVHPDTVMAFRGGLTSENPRYWAPGKKRNNQMELDTAMSKSVNPVFGRLAHDYVGKDSLLAYTERFGFNQALFPGTQVQPSRTGNPQTPEDVMLMGAGLGRDVKLSPFHAAAITAAVANQGMMMAPVLAQEITTRSGERIFSASAQPLRRIVTPETANQLAKMLSSTVQTGTSRRAFHDRRGRQILGPLTIAAKTGSINGTEPTGHYSWFTAYAPIEDPKIALVALVVNHDKWKIKASQVGEKALETFFK
jgi:cell division protein FtsI/penicillin-binding protein 2